MSRTGSVQITRREYDDLKRLASLAEDEIDAAVLRELRKDSRPQDFLPVASVRRILAGENKVKVWREFRTKSEPDLAALAGLDTGELTRIESGALVPSIACLKRLAAALDVQVDDLV
jgi:transcriptional regulator with XRE-family HTH domain